MTRAFGPIHDLRLKMVVTRGPIAKTIVAAKRSQGITASNAFCEVDSKSTAPLMPPAMLATIAGLTGMFKVSISFRYAQALASTPGNSATVLVAFATMEGTPVNTSAGNVRNEPPPATALISPAPRTAATRKRQQL